MPKAEAKNVGRKKNHKEQQVFEEGRKMTPLVVGQASLLLTLQPSNYVHFYKSEGDKKI